MDNDDHMVRQYKFLYNSRGSDTKNKFAHKNVGHSEIYSVHILPNLYPFFIEDEF